MHLLGKLELGDGARLTPFIRNHLNSYHPQSHSLAFINTCKLQHPIYPFRRSSSSSHQAMGLSKVKNEGISYQHRRYTITELLEMRRTLPYVCCPVKKFKPEAWSEKLLTKVVSSIILPDILIAFYSTLLTFSKISLLILIYGFFVDLFY